MLLVKNVHSIYLTILTYALTWHKDAIPNALIIISTLFTGVNLSSLLLHLLRVGYIVDFFSLDNFKEQLYIYIYMFDYCQRGILELHIHFFF